MLGGASGFEITLKSIKGVQRTQGERELVLELWCNSLDGAVSSGRETETEGPLVGSGPMTSASKKGASEITSL